MRVVFMGTPEFSVSILNSLVKHHEVICVYTQPPRPAGKGYQLRPSAVQVRAEELGIPVRSPVTLRNVDEQVEFSALNADVAVVCAYGLILPKPILEAPKHGCINVHASLLPRWRGAAPIQRSIESGDSETGITIMQMDVGLDTGDMLMSDVTPITEETTTPLLHDKLAAMGADLIIKTLATLNTIMPQKQPTEGVTYAAKLEKREGLIDWTKSADEIGRKVRAFMPVPSTYFMYKEERIKVLAARPLGDTTEELAGVVISQIPLCVACGTGILELLRLQREGKKPVDAADFQKGYTLRQGERLEI